MAFDIKNQKWKRRSLAVLSVALCASLTVGTLAACKKDESDNQEDEPSVVAPVDTQLLKNGNFEFFTDKNKTEQKERYGLINTATSWSFTSGSPASEAASGIIDVAEWDNFAKSGTYNFSTFTKGEGSDAKEVRTFQTIEEAVQNWENPNVTAYDRVKFLDIFKSEISALDANSESKKLFNKYSYSVDFDDLKKLDEDFPGGVSLHAGANSDETGILMIHNDKNSDNVRGTAQYYTSSTTVSLTAGTGAKLSVWVKTDKLFHYADTEVNARAGAYIGVVNTVGGTTLDQMQIFNINTHGEWQKYDLYIRANTFASSTFRIVLGLGQGSSDDRYYAVDGYAFFDDVTCEKISSAEFESAVLKDTESMTPQDGIKLCTIDSLRDEKRFDVDTVKETTFALDLFAGFDSDSELLKNAEIALTKETLESGATYTSASIDDSLFDNTDINFTRVAKVSELESSQNKYVKNVYDNDFKDKFPFGGYDSEVVMLLSANGAAYSADLTSPLFTLAPASDPNARSRMLISFFVKTSKIENGLTGASASIMEGKKATSTIAAFDSTTLAGVDIDDTRKDIYNGWTQCFFFVENTTEEEKTFSLRLSYGPTTILGTNKFSYGDGYAAFANFEVRNLSKTQYGYATTNDRAQKVSLTGGNEEIGNFDAVSVTDEETIKEMPALPANYYGVSGGSNSVIEGGEKNKRPEELGVTAGLLSFENAENYYASDEAWRNRLGGTVEGANSWWKEVFSDARQPLVIINGDEAASYGFVSSETSTVSTSSYQRISMRVKASEGAKAYIYIMDTTSENTGKALSVSLPAYTYWYDNNGNICAIDPSDKDFDEDTDILFRLEENGLYKKVGEAGDIYYANLSSYESDSDGNLMTKDEEIVFFFNNNTYYAYRDEDRNGNYTYSVPVQPLPAEIVRYDNSNGTAQQAQIVVEGTGEWVNVYFYIHTGDAEKTFRIEVWSGDRAGGEGANPAGSYVIFDNFKSESASSDYSNALNESVQSIRDELNEGKSLEEDDYLSTSDPLPKDYENAKYYTYTFFDSPKYVRYDKTTDTEEKGDPWHAYLQSTYSEQLVSLYQADKNSEGKTTTQKFFLDFGATDITVTADYPNGNDDTTDTDDTNTTTGGTANIWLLISSGVLAVALLFVIVVVIFRKVFSKRKRAARIKNSTRSKKGKAKSESV